MSQENTSPAPSSPSSKSGYVKLAIFSLAILTIATIGWKLGLTEKVSPKNLASNLGELRDWANRPYGPPLFILMSVAFILLHLPELFIIIIGGMVYDFWKALIFTWLGCNTGISTAFLIARFFLRDAFRPALEKSFLRTLDQRLKHDGFSAIIVLRMVLFLFPPLNWAMGASSIKTRDYLIGSSIAVTPWLVAILLVVGKLMEAESLLDLLRPDILVIVVPSAAVIVALLLLRRKLFPEAKREE